MNDPQTLIMEKGKSLGRSCIDMGPLAFEVTLAEATALVRGILIKGGVRRIEAEQASAAFRRAAHYEWASAWLTVSEPPGSA